ncbi:hypothetical protein BP6252_08317 [Coleophoma cylindrospora]|uniref:MEI5 protein n=1 Tax=Coleophoma cylindrospora TaxID=1849047 RepID=A0A3D8R5M4_9HELO|nr:hypothetical protein BP6252_08317 [Coleophoma cylindrospora]
MPSQNKIAGPNSDTSLKKQAVNGHATDVSMQLVEAFIGSVQTLATSNSFQDLRGMITSLSTLRHEVDAQREENNILKAELEQVKAKHDTTCCDLAESYGKSVEKIKDEKADLERQLLTSKEELNRAKEARKKEEINKQKADTTAQRSIADLKASLKKAEAEKGTLNGELQKMKEELALFRSYTKHLHSNDVVTYTKQFEGLWDSARKLVGACFMKDLPDATIQTPTAWKEFKERAKLPQEIPIPRSNSRPAKQMRIAAVLAVLAQLLNQFIFTPTYVLQEDDELREVLLHEAEAHPDRESLCRGLLLLMSDNKPFVAEEERVGAVVRKVTWVLQALVEGTFWDKFREDLKVLVEKAVRGWSDVQRHKERFEPNIDLRSLDDWEWRKVNFAENVPPTGQGSPDGGFTKSDGILVLFPGLYAVDHLEYEAIFPGVVLLASQTKLAADEVEKERTSNGALDRTISKKARRMSRVSTSGTTEGAAGGNENTPFLD